MGTDGCLYPRSAVCLQVLRAQAAGATAAIVYDDAYEPLVIMNKLANTPEPGIPSVFVSQQTGIVMNRLLKAGVTAAILLPVRHASGTACVFASLQAVSVRKALSGPAWRMPSSLL